MISYCDLFILNDRFYFLQGFRMYVEFQMGNQLSGIAPSQILPVDHYLTDMADYEFDIR